jgi:hypothetical protein
MRAEAGAVLVCTVGGSHQPILTALKARPWGHVVFVCTAAAEGMAASAGMVEQAVDRGPPIPVMAGLDPGRFEIVIVPPDDPDAAFAVLHDKLRALGRDRPGVTTVAVAEVLTGPLRAGDKVVSHRRRHLQRRADGDGRAGRS